MELSRTPKVVGIENRVEQSLSLVPTSPAVIHTIRLQKSEHRQARRPFARLLPQVFRGARRISGAPKLRHFSISPYGRRLCRVVHLGRFLDATTYSGCTCAIRPRCAISHCAPAQGQSGQGLKSGRGGGDSPTATARGSLSRVLSAGRRYCPQQQFPRIWGLAPDSQGIN